MNEIGAIGAGNTVPARQEIKIDKVSQDFEAVFIAQMMSEMFSSEELNDFFGGGTAGDIYKSLMMNEYGKTIAKAGGIGIADQIKKELLKLQEIQGQEEN